MSRTYADSRPSSTRPSSPLDGDVVDDAHAVAEPVGTAPLDGLPDRRQPERLSRVDGEVGVLALEVLERVEVTRGRKPASAPAMSKPATPLSRHATDSSAISRERAWWRMAVSSWRTTIRPAGGAAGPSPSSKPSLDGRPPPRRGSGPGDVLLGGVAHLGVHDAIGGEVLDALARDPGQRVAAAASRRPCGRRSRGSARATRSRPTRRTSAPGPRRRRRAARARSHAASSTTSRAQTAVEVVVQQRLRGARHLIAGGGARWRWGHWLSADSWHAADPGRPSGRASARFGLCEPSPPRRDRRPPPGRDRHHRVADDRPGAAWTPSRRHGRPPVDPRGRRARRGWSVRRHDRPRLPHALLLPLFAPRSSASRRQEPSSTTGSTRCASRARASRCRSAPAPAWSR